jgi:hypothetical protein
MILIIISYIYCTTLVTWSLHHPGDISRASKRAKDGLLGWVFFYAKYYHFFYGHIYSFNDNHWPAFRSDNVSLSMNSGSHCTSLLLRQRRIFSTNERLEICLLLDSSHAIGFIRGPFLLRSRNLVPYYKQHWGVRSAKRVASIYHLSYLQSKTTSPLGIYTPFCHGHSTDCPASLDCLWHCVHLHERLWG